MRAFLDIITIVRILFVEGEGLVKPAERSNKFIQGALTLTIAALFIKILSAVYRVPFQNIVGDVGFYIYQQVYPLYGLALVFSTYGFPVVISKLYSERLNNHDLAGVKRLIFVSFIFLYIFGLIGFFVLYFGAEWIASVMYDPHLAILIRVISIVFLIVPIIAVIRGCFQGKGNMLPTAYSQVGEQFFRVTTILAAAIILMNEQFNLYVVGAGAAFGSVTGAVVAAIILITFIWVRRKRLQKPYFEAGELFQLKDTKVIIKTLFIEGFAICISSMLLLFMQLADALNLYSLLITSGINGEDAKELKGIYDRGQPLIQLGSVVATSMALSLVPLIASEKVKNNYKSLHEKIQLALKVSITVGLGATVGLVAIMKPTNTMLFENNNGSEVLALLSVIVLISSVIITVVSILQGLGLTIFPALIMVVGFLLKYMLNILFVPAHGTWGAAVSSNIALLIIAVILLNKVYRTIRRPLLPLGFLLKAAAASMTMFISLYVFQMMTDILYSFGPDRLFATIQALAAVVIGGVIYLFVVIRWKMFTIAELTLLPFGSNIMKFFPRNNRS